MSPPNEIEETDDLVTPWDVTASSAKGVDYDKLISDIPVRLLQNRVLQSDSAVGSWEKI